MISGAKSKDDYLARINEFPEEKANIGGYMAGLGKNDIVLEVGPGGGAAFQKLLEVIRGLDPKERPYVIALDILKPPLHIVRNILKTVNAEITDGGLISGIQIQGNVTQLPLKSGTITAANISSVVHEVFSYSGGEEGIQNFVRELAQVMKLGGIVAYRDPEGTELYKSAATFLKSRLIRTFAASFLKKYFANGDKEKMHGPGSKYLENFRLSINGSRIQPEDIFIQRLNEAESVLLSSYAGLIHELKRHFIVFMTTFFPEVFHEMDSIDNDHVRCVFSRNSGVKALKDFCSQNNLKISESENERTVILSTAVFQAFESDVISRFENIYRPTELKCKRPEEADLVDSFLLKKGIKHILDGEKIVIRFEELVIIYADLQEFAEDNGIILSMREDAYSVCNWFEREGRESYFYGDDIDVLTTFIENSLNRDRENSAIGYTCFVPISVDHSEFVARPYYTVYVSSSVSDVEGEYPDGKRNIHFVKKPLEEAFAVLFAMYQKDGDERLRKILDNLLKLAQNSLDTQKSSSEKRVAEDELFEQITQNVQVIGLVGGIASGKTSVGEILAEHGFKICELSRFIKEEIESMGILKPRRADYFDVANGKRRENGNDFWARRAYEELSGLEENLIISGIRTTEEIDFLRSKFKNFLAIAVTAPIDTRIERVKKRLREIDPESIDGVIADMNREMADDKPGGCQMAATMAVCDTTIDSSENLASLREECLAFLKRIGKIHT